MENDEVQSIRTELRLLSYRVVRDDVTSDELPGYLNAMLGIELVEPHACCRIAAAELARRYPGMPPRHVAAELLRVARRYRRPELKTLSPIADSERPERSDDSQQPSSTLPEFSLSVGFTAVGSLHLVTWLTQIARNPVLGWDNWEWSVVMSSGYLVAGILFFYSALAQLLRNRRWSKAESAVCSKPPNARDCHRSQIVRFHTKHSPPA